MYSLSVHGHTNLLGLVGPLADGRTTPTPDEHHRARRAVLPVEPTALAQYEPLRLAQ